VNDSRTGIVRLDGRPVGRLVESPDRRFVTFLYDEPYLAAPDAVPVSLTIPLAPKPIETWGLHPFFRNLLPEGWLRALALAKLRVDEEDEFGLLLATGADCAGAVEVVPGDPDSAESSS
jgi:serine/threonine-protein kinase HipA